VVYRNRKIEKSVLCFLRTLPSDILCFPFDIRKAVNTLEKCKMHAYQNFAWRNRVPLQDVIDFCQSETGCTHKQDDKYIIMYNGSSKFPNERIKYTIAHELGHIILGHHEIIRQQQIAQNDRIDKALEREANYFAACILCPIPIIHQMKLESVYCIEDAFEVSREAAVIAWNDYYYYNKSYNIPWHNDMIRLYENANQIKES